MIAECISTSYKACQDNLYLMDFLGRGKNGATEELPNLRKGEKYLVVAFAFGPFSPWLFIADRAGLRYPLMYPAILFSIVDSSISRFWELGKWDDWRGGRNSLLAPTQWAIDPMFHGKLFEGDPESLTSYESDLKKLMLEYPLPWIDEKATSLGEGSWVTDDDYTETWEADPLMKMTIHPKTGMFMHNPIAK